jgi:nucleotide-binding universal stress UspA family protein
MANPVSEHPIVVGVDGSPAAWRAGAWAAAEAARAHVPLRLVHCCALGVVRQPRHLPPPPAYRTAVLAQGRHWLNDAARRVRACAPDVALSTDMRAGLPADVLIDESRTASLVVVGSRGTGGFRELLLGSVAVALAAHGHCPVIVHRGTDADGQAEDVRPVVVGVDGSPLSDAAVGFAFEEAAARRAPLVAVHTWLDVNTAGMWAGLPTMIDWPTVQADEECVLTQKLARWQKEYETVPVRTVVLRDRPEHALQARSAHAQLVVVGSRGRGSLAALGLGSVSNALLHTARCPVAVVRPESGAVHHLGHNLRPGAFPAA